MAGKAPDDPLPKHLIQCQFTVAGLLVRFLWWGGQCESLPVYGAIDVHQERLNSWLEDNLASLNLVYCRLTIPNGLLGYSDYTPFKRPAFSSSDEPSPGFTDKPRLGRGASAV
jgi:hypothetical protein